MLQIIIGAIGFVLVFMGGVVLLSRRCYVKFSKTLYVEKISAENAQKVKERILSDDGDRYLTALVMIVFGISSIAWAFGSEHALGWPFALFF
jgi:hypothetical protein